MSLLCLCLVVAGGRPKERECSVALEVLGCRWGWRVSVQGSRVEGYRCSIALDPPSRVEF